MRPADIFHNYLLNRCDTLDDLDMVLERSRLAGVKSMILTGGSLHESREALQLAETHGSPLIQRTINRGTDRAYHRLLRDGRVPSYTVRSVR